MRSRWAKISIGLVVVLVIVYVVLALLARPAADRAFFAQVQHRPLVIAHRGGRGLWPENTQYAFEQAAAMGVDVLEMDLHSTADGVPVVLHDDTVDRTTDGSGPVQALTLAALQGLDAGYGWSPDGGQTFPYRDQGITIPTLEEVFATLPTVPMNIEIKQTAPSLIAPLCRLIREYGMMDRVLIASTDDETIQEFRRECPEVATSASQGEVLALWILSKVYLEGIYSPAFQAVQVPERRGNLHVLTPRFVDAAHHRNLEVHAWTINDVDDMQRLLSLGLSGIITDYPDRLMEVVAR